MVAELSALRLLNCHGHHIAVAASAPDTSASASVGVITDTKWLSCTLTGVTIAAFASAAAGAIDIAATTHADLYYFYWYYYYYYYDIIIIMMIITICLLWLIVLLLLWDGYDYDY